MEFFTQDDNFEMMHLTDDESLISTIEGFDLPWEETGDVVEASVNHMKCAGKIRLTRHLHVTQNYVPKYKKYTPTSELNYENLIGPFFATYMQEYVERQSGKYDELLSTVRKLLKVHITGKTTKKLICLNDVGKFCLTCIDITKDKATWRKDDFKMILRYFEFTLKKVKCCDTVPCDPECCDEVSCDPECCDTSIPTSFPEPGPVATVAPVKTEPTPHPDVLPPPPAPPAPQSQDEELFNTEHAPPLPPVDMAIEPDFESGQ